MIDANRISGLSGIMQYGKAKGFMAARRYNLPTFNHFYILESDDDVNELLNTFKDQNDFCMRADTKIGNPAIRVSGRNVNRKTLREFYESVKEQERKLGTKGVAIVYWNDGKFCTTYDVDGCFYLDFLTNNELKIDFIGKGWDGSCLSHGSACHETYSIPWDEIPLLDDKTRTNYRKRIVSPEEYNDLRKARIENLVMQKISREIAERAVPTKYNGMDDEHFLKVVDQVIMPMYKCIDLQSKFKEYIPIVQIENGNPVVPEIILPERLRFKEVDFEDEGR